MLCTFNRLRNGLDSLLLLASMLRNLFFQRVGSLGYICTCVDLSLTGDLINVLIKQVKARG